MRRPDKRSQGFPQRLQSLVDKEGTIEALANTSGVSSRTLGDWLRGVRVPHGSKLLQFCQAMKVDPDWLARGTEPNRHQIGLEIPPDRQLYLHSLDGGQTLGMVSNAWLASRFGIREDEDVLLFHAQEDIGHEIDRGEPVLIRPISLFYTWTEGEILLVEDESGVLGLQKVAKEGKINGVVVGTAFWVGRSLAVRRRT